MMTLILMIFGWYLGEIDDDINLDDISDEISDEIDDIINGWYWWWH